LTGVLEKVRFLIVDDNAHMVGIVKTILKGFGAEHVFDARDTAEAMQRLKNEAIDIIILDYQLGEEDGVAFLHRLRTSSESPAPFMPVIMLTAHADKVRVEAARDAGATEFCAKPVNAAEMLRKVAAVIDRPRPFVRTEGYFGPDRRRRADPDHSGPNRRKDASKPDG
jgi:two-component system chemotaxis response regulator CheY